VRIGNLSRRLTLFTDHGAIDVEQASDGRFDADPQAVYGRWDEFTEWAATAKNGAVPFEAAELGPPAPRPTQVFAVGVNYREHAAEGGVGIPSAPMLFTKWVSSVTGPVGDIELPSESVDWEVELVAVIGRRARRVPVERAWDHIAGLTAGQDISERAVQMGIKPFSQLSLAKSFPGFSPTGPWLVTPDEFTDPDDLEVACSVNGETMQRAHTSDLVFSIPALVAELSAVLTLEPGDVLWTGTPGGVGLGRKPPQYLRPGDELVTTIQGIGEMRHRFVSA
jgi:2,4-diketo-3-deoxy-L-fuconate hydrolase